MIITRGDGKYNFLTPDMKFLCDEWYDEVVPFDEFGRARVAKKLMCICKGEIKVWNYIKEDGTTLFQIWADKVNPFTVFDAVGQTTDGKFVYLNNDMSGIMLNEFNHKLLDLPLALVEDSGGSRYIDINGNTPDCLREDKYQIIQIDPIKTKTQESIRKMTKCKEDNLVYRADRPLVLCEHKPDNLRILCRIHD